MADIEKGNNKFYIGDDPNQPLAEIIYEHSGEGLIIIAHTYVSESLKGQGIGLQLVDSVATMARQQALKIRPVCSFALKVMTRTADYEDILEKQ